MKKLLILFCVIFLSLILSGTVYSVENEYTIEEKTEQEFFSSLDPEIIERLEDNGITSLDPDTAFSDGFDGIKNYFSETLSEKIKGSMAWFFMVLCILMILGVISSAYDFSSSGDVFSLFCSLILSVVVIDKISIMANCVVSAVTLNGKLMLTFIPIFTLLVSLSGNPAGAVSYNGTVLLFCELMSAFIENVFMILLGAYFSLSVAFSFNGNINLNRFVNSVNRTVTFILGFLASTFTALLSLKNILAYSKDSVSVKGIRFLVSNLIPVIGPSLSDAYSTVLGSVHLMKSALGVVGILAIIIINIPALVEGAVYCCLLYILSCFSEVIGLTRGTETLRSFYTCVRILLLICLFQVFVLVVSTGMMLSVKGG